MSPDDPNQEIEHPADVLMEQERETSSDFFSKVRNKIQRRTAASQFASYSWYLPKVVLMEMAAMLGHIFTTAGGKKES
jgi:hypothetical protein